MSELGSSISSLRRQGLHKAKTLVIPKKPIGIKTPLERGSGQGESLFRMHFEITRQIEDNLKNLLMTQKGERLGFPEFGTQLKEIYSNNTYDNEEIVNIASTEVQDAVSKFMPSISLTEFYSQKVDLGEPKLNSSNNIAADFLNSQQSLNNISSNGFKITNFENKNIDSVYEIKIKYFIPLINKNRQITLMINSSS